MDNQEDIKMKLLYQELRRAVEYKNGPQFEAMNDGEKQTWFDWIIGWQFAHLGFAISSKSTYRTGWVSEKLIHRCLELMDKYGYSFSFDEFKKGETVWDHYITRKNATQSLFEGLDVGRITDYESFIDEFMETFMQHLILKSEHGRLTQEQRNGDGIEAYKRSGIVLYHVGDGLFNINNSRIKKSILKTALIHNKIFLHK